MVEHTIDYNLIFQALADETRRDILQRLLSGQKSISELADKYTMSCAGVAKHLSVLHKAGLIRKDKLGRLQVVSAEPKAIRQVMALLQEYERVWTERYDRLDEF